MDESGLFGGQVVAEGIGSTFTFDHANQRGTGSERSRCVGGLMQLGDGFQGFAFALGGGIHHGGEGLSGKLGVLCCAVGVQRVEFLRVFFKIFNKLKDGVIFLIQRRNLTLRLCGQDALAQGEGEGAPAVIVHVVEQG